MYKVTSATNMSLQVPDCLKEGNVELLEKDMNPIHIDLETVDDIHLSFDYDSIRFGASSDCSYNNGIQLYETGCIRNMKVEADAYSDLVDYKPDPMYTVELVVEADVIPSLKSTSVISPETEWFAPRGYSKAIKKYGVYVSLAISDDFCFYHHLNCKCKGESDIHNDPDWTGSCSHIVAVQLAMFAWLLDKSLIQENNGSPLITKVK